MSTRASREDALRGERVRDLGELALAADEARQAVGQIGGEGIERAQRLELRGKVRMRDAEDLLGATEIAQAMDAEVDELCRVGETVGDEVTNGARDDNLAAVGDSPQARAAVERLPEVVALITQLRLASVDGDPHPKQRRRRPLL
jgi:hypothetical protein